MTYTFELPLYTMLGRKKIPLNLNWYRNAHYRDMHKVKLDYWPLQSHPFKADKIKVSYELKISNNTRTDAQNWIAIADKFFLDWLVDRGYIKDDSTAHYSSGSWSSEKKLDEKQHRLYAFIEVVK